MATRHVNLTEHFDRFIERGVASGRFSNASEMVRQGLRLLEQQEQEDRAKLEWLRGAVQEGLDDLESGDSTTLRSRDEIGAFLNEMLSELPARSVSVNIQGPVRLAAL
ncbi:MAG: type II toxin-antitoxin system ParD family antitoxin [Acidobacteria bacterium]|nr:type II toxin-antitoxin system ParD family antitoxin [Acidobacteriota bacterium]